MQNRKAISDLFLISAVGLFLELVLIRWVASELRMIAFYKNFALIGAFLGLGLGFALHRQKGARLNSQHMLPWLVSATVLVVLLLGRTQLADFILANQANAQEYVWAGYVGDSTAALLINIAFYAILLLIFLSITLIFIPLGSLTAEKFQAFPPLRGYTINILGSLAGILLFSLISFLRWPPYTWFLVSAAGIGYFLLEKLPPQPRVMFGALLLFPSALTLLAPSPADTILWSPYYRIDLNAVYAEGDPDLLLGHELLVNQAWHQQLWNLDPDFVAENYESDTAHFDTRMAVYDLPFSVSNSLENVLIVGAGSGNDVAAALRAGAGQITAVEIDPVILDIGRNMHPEEPYAGLPNVELVVQDARSFFRSSKEIYDLISFGRLDSHTLFSAASSVRLDNFVYTLESLMEVRGLLADDGMLVLSFGVADQNEWIGLRLYRLLTDVFGHEPQVYDMPDDTTMFVVAQTAFSEPVIDDPRVNPRPDYYYDEDIEVTTDQWPFLYLRERAIPTTYLIGLAGVVLISAVLVRRSLTDFRQFNLHFAFMGAAFFLLETKSITEIALLLGSTWIVNAAVIAAILIMIVAANMLVGRFEIKNVKPYYIGLGITLVLNYLVPISGLLGLSLVWRIILASLALSLPMFFAGVIFAITFSQTQSIESALGSNLVGAVLGGMVEYSSLALGIRSLYLFALLFYALSALAWFRKAN
jgi:spermidine synthase